MEEITLKLHELGWNNHLEEAFLPYKETHFTVGRVGLEHKGSYRIFTEAGVLLGEISGKMRFESTQREDFPAVGDWVVIQARPEEKRATIHAVLPRKSKFSRKTAGLTTEEQIIAANVDTLFIVTALNQDFNPRRVERYMIMAWESGANPVIVLSKADLCENPDEKVSEMESVAFGVPIIVISAKENMGVEKVADFIQPGQTMALLGSSGVGKSTLINTLAGEEIQKVQDIREDDDKGRHTTTHREMVLLPTGGILIDTPGMREFQLWEANEGLEHSFQDIESLAEQCLFRDCRHQTEPKCAVQEAIASGELDLKRYESYLKLQRELAYIERKTNQKVRLEDKKKWKNISKFQKNYNKGR
nr:ribosome small subunit-dependent GTPase A [Bacillus litorisediminis]